MSWLSWFRIEALHFLRPVYHASPMAALGGRKWIEMEPIPSFGLQHLLGSQGGAQYRDRTGGMATPFLRAEFRIILGAFFGGISILRSLRGQCCSSCKNSA